MPHISKARLFCCRLRAVHRLWKRSLLKEQADILSMFLWVLVFQINLYWSNEVSFCCHWRWFEIRWSGGVKSWGGICWGLMYQLCWIWRWPPISLSVNNTVLIRAWLNQTIWQRIPSRCSSLLKTRGNVFRYIGLQITNGQAPVTLSAQACFCWDTDRLWPGKFYQS